MSKSFALARFGQTFSAYFGYFVKEMYSFLRFVRRHSVVTSLLARLGYVEELTDEAKTAKMSSEEEEDLLQELAEQFGSSFPTEEVAKSLACSDVIAPHGRAHAVFTTHYRPKDEETFLTICGSEEELGSWNPHKGLVADRLANYRDWWIAITNVPVDTEMEWKWVAVTGDEVRWEEGENRKCEAGQEGLIQKALWDRPAVTGSLERLIRVAARLRLSEESMARRYTRRLSQGVQTVVGGMFRRLSLQQEDPLQSLSSTTMDDDVTSPEDDVTTNNKDD